jgi:hypothetical protein
VATVRARSTSAIDAPALPRHHARMADRCNIHDRLAASLRAARKARGLTLDTAANTSAVSTSGDVTNALSPRDGARYPADRSHEIAADTTACVILTNWKGPCHAGSIDGSVRLS